MTWSAVLSRGAGSIKPLTRLLTTEPAQIVLLFLLVLACWHQAVPYGNEFIYLIGPYAQSHPEFLPGDWTFGTPWREHLVFNTLVAGLMRIGSLEAVGWIGRVTCWIFILVGLFRLGRRFGIPPVLAGLSIAVWFAAGEGLVGGEWMLRMFEAKTVAYALLLFALDRLLAGKDVSGAILLGLCFSFHPSVGATAALGVGAGLLALRYPTRRLLTVVGITAISSLPGLVPVLSVLAGSEGGGGHDWRFIARVVMPWHLDPVSFPRREILTLGLLFLFSVLHAARNRGREPLRFLMAFQAVLAAIFAAGLLFRFTDHYELLKIFPFRLFPLFAPLLALFHMMNAYHERRNDGLTPVLALVGLLALLALPNPLVGVLDRARLAAAYRMPDDDLARSFRWLAAYTPNDAIVILPPWREDGYYLARRPQIASLHAVRYDRIPEWRARIEAMVGSLEGDSPAALDEARLAARYDSLGASQITAMVTGYGGDYLVSRGAYSYPVMFESGSYRVYDLAGVGDRAR